jgi:hypothetical protein
MVTIHQANVQTRMDISPVSLAEGIGWGLPGGLVATLVMDLVLIGAFAAVGLPAFTCFSIVGEAVARFFSLHGVGMAGSVPLGIAVHYLIGPVLAMLFGAIVVKVHSLRIDTRKKCVVFAALYAEILSQPILASAPLLISMTASETLQWFGGALLMHLIWGTVLGIFMSRALRLQFAAKLK